MRGLNLAAAICVHAIVGFMFIGLAENLSDSPGGFGSSLAAVLWVAGLLLMIAWRNSAPGRIWLVPLLWPIAGWFAGLGIVVVGGLVYWYGFHRRGEATSGTRAPARPGEFRRQLGLVDATARSLEQQVREAIALARAAPSAAVFPAAVAPAPVRVGQVRTFPAPGAKPTAAKKPQKPPKPPREIDWSIFLGARALAWAGGLVMILGIVFFFVLAANRGWLTPEIRVGLGSATSAATFCAGLWLKRRFGHLYSALAAVSAGIAGAYATLLAA